MKGSSARQLLIVLIACALAGAFRPVTLISLACSYFAAWCGVNAARVFSVPAPSWSRGQWIIAAAVLTLPLITTVNATFHQTLETEGLLGASEHIRDRVRLRGLAIAPPLIVADQPQRFFVHADAAQVLARFPERAVEATSLGHGLFRLDYDPTRDGTFSPGEVTLGLSLDGGEDSVSMRAVTRYAHPRLLTVSPDRKRAATVSTETDQVFVVRGDEVVSAPTLDQPSACAFLPGGELIVVHARDGALLFSADLQPRRLPLPSASAIAANEKYVALASSHRVALLSAEALARGQLDVVFAHPLPAPADHVALIGDRVVVAIRRGALLLLASARGVATLPLGRPAVALTTGPAETVLVSVTDYQPGGERHLGNHFIDDQILTVSANQGSLAVVEQTRTQARTPRQGSAGNVDRGVSPLGLHHVDGATYVAFAGTAELMVQRPMAPPRFVDLPDPLAVPLSVAITESEAGTRIIVTATGGRIGILNEAGETLTVHQLAPSDEALARDDEHALKRRFGERVFYESTRAGVSCQSCHLHGSTDEAAHNIGERRLAPTLDVRGLMSTSPYLRDGSFPRLSDLEDLATDLYRGWARAAPSRGLTLDAFMGGLPYAPPAPDRATFSALRDGVDVFVSSGCAGCHSFPAFTNLGQEIAATLFAGSDPARVLDTPSLIGLGRSAPYFHDGRADTLHAVLDDNENNLHGDTARLSPAERAALLSFLESL